MDLKSFHLIFKPGENKKMKTDKELKSLQHDIISLGNVLSERWNMFSSDCFYNGSWHSCEHDDNTYHERECKIDRCPYMSDFQSHLDFPGDPNWPWVRQKDKKDDKHE